jgi:hypothetical protein
MRRTHLLGLLAVVAVVSVVSVLAVTVVDRDRPGAPGAPTVRTVPGCPRAPATVDVTPVHLVADLDHVTVRDSAWRGPVLAAADNILAGAIPAVRPHGPAEDGGDPLRYLYDEGVALRRVTGVLGLAYAARHDPRYLDFLAAQTVGAARWPDWNPGHPLDTAQLATAVALGYAWSRNRMTPEERGEVVSALVDRLLLPYTCGTGHASAGLRMRRATAGNQTTVVATAAVLAGLAVRPDQPAWSAAAVEAGSASLARHAGPDGSGRSLADGPTIEGLMYTTYEAANLALLRATVQANPHDPAVTGPLNRALPDLTALAEWNERCGRVAEPAVQDGWDLYPWVDRATALAAMASTPGAGPHLQALIDALQARDRLTIPAAGAWPVPDAIAELLLSQSAAAGGAAAPAAQTLVSGGAHGARLYGCTTHGDTYALVTGVPNDAPHAHSDVGNVVVKQGEQTLLDDLGQRDYGFHGGPVWRASTKAHSTLGVLQPDGSVVQRRNGSGAVTADGDGLLMTSTSALAGVSSWQRRVVVGDGTVQVHDTLTAASGAALPISASFLLAAPPASVVGQPDGAVRFTVADGSVWDLVPPAGTTVTWSDAAPTPPYVDAPSIAAPAAGHTLVVIHTDLTGTLDLTTDLRRVGAAATSRGP